jgi:hypothetical protein
MVAAFLTSSVSDRSLVGGGGKEKDVLSYFVRERITRGEKSFCLSSKLYVNLNVRQECMFVNVKFLLTAILGSLLQSADILLFICL